MKACDVGVGNMAHKSGMLDLDYGAYVALKYQGLFSKDTPSGKDFKETALEIRHAEFVGEFEKAESLRAKMKAMNRKLFIAKKEWLRMQ